jgi:hypothetical protein
VEGNGRARRSTAGELRPATPHALPTSFALNRAYIAPLVCMPVILRQPGPGCALTRKNPPMPPVVSLLHRPQLLSEWEEAGRCIDVVTDGSPGDFTEIVSQGKSGASTTSAIRSAIRHLVVATDTPPA